MYDTSKLITLLALQQLAQAVCDGFMTVSEGESLAREIENLAETVALETEERETALSELQETVDALSAAGTGVKVMTVSSEEDIESADFSSYNDGDIVLVVTGD